MRGGSFLGLLVIFAGLFLMVIGMRRRGAALKAAIQQLAGQK